MNLLKLQIVEKIEDSLNRYEETTSFFSIAKFMSENKDNSHFWSTKPSIFDIAVLTNISPSTVTRYSQDLGLAGFKELSMIMHADDLGSNKAVPENTPEQPGLYHRNLWIDEFIDPTVSLNLPTLQNIHQELTQKNRIYFFGFEGFPHLIQPVISPLQQKGYEVFTSQNFEKQVTYSKELTNSDIAIVAPFEIDNSSYEIIFRTIGEQNATLILITKNWLNFELTFIKQKYLLRISGIEDRYLGDGANEATILFILKLVSETLPRRSLPKFNE